MQPKINSETQHSQNCAKKPAEQEQIDQPCNYDSTGTSVRSRSILIASLTQEMCDKRYAYAI